MFRSAVGAAFLVGLSSSLQLPQTGCGPWEEVAAVGGGGVRALGPSELPQMKRIR